MTDQVTVTVQGSPPFLVAPGPQRKIARPRSQEAAARLKHECEQELRRISGVQEGFWRPWDLKAGKYSLIIDFQRKDSQRDAANIIGEIANVLQGILYDNDGQLTEIHYLEKEGQQEQYSVTVRPNPELP